MQLARIFKQNASNGELFIKVIYYVRFLGEIGTHVLFVVRNGWTTVSSNSV